MHVFVKNNHLIDGMDPIVAERITQYPDTEGKTQLLSFSIANLIYEQYFLSIF